MVETLITKNWKADNFSCDCSTSKFKDKFHGHIVTGDLNVITNQKLRSLLTKGPSYREANEINWMKVFHHIKTGVNNCVENWCAKEKVDTVLLSQWKSLLLHEIRVKIHSLKHRQLKNPKKVLDDKEVNEFLHNFHKKIVITPTDKASNNFSIVCKKFYISCLLKELNISESNNVKQSQSTYERLKSKPNCIVERHIKYMKDHNIDLAESQLKLPFIYWIPKMHKTPSKQRYIAASHSCSTKPLSKMITFCLKLIQSTHTNYCKQIAKNNGYNRMWIVDNSVEVIEKINKINERKNVKNIRTYDFSTLYTSIPHTKLKQQMKWVISQAFNDKARKFIRIGNVSAHWNKSRGKTKYCWDKDELIKHVSWLIDNIYVVCGDSLFKQKIGIPMGTDCAPFLANLFLFAYEFKWLLNKFKKKEYDSLNKFLYCFRYIDDLLCINNDQLMDDIKSEIYPEELSLTSDDAVLQTHYLDLDLEIRNNKIHSKLFDKRDAFGFSIVNFPDLSGNIPNKQSYGVFVSQLIRYARCCMDIEDFTFRTKKLVTRLINQNFEKKKLVRVFEKFTESYYELLFKYNCSINFICDYCC